LQLAPANQAAQGQDVPVGPTRKSQYNNSSVVSDQVYRIETCDAQLIGRVCGGASRQRGHGKGARLATVPQQTVWRHWRGATLVSTAANHMQMATFTAV